MTDMSSLLGGLSMRALFPTPIVIGELPQDLQLTVHPPLTDLIKARAAADRGVSASNQGGWQSSPDLPDWGGETVRPVIEAILAIIGHITLQHQQGGLAPAAIDWKINGWANINRRGDANALHCHPGAFWSAVYYLAADHTPEEGGAFEMRDPRGVMPRMYCPALAMGVQGTVSAGGSEFLQPKTGQIIVFPSWLVHAVTPYTGEGTRISLAFNFSV